MKVVHITAGAAGMYCGSCLHDNTLASALLSAGDDVLLVPMYTPIRTDEQDVSHPRIFLGGINVALQQQWSVFRHTPWWLDRLLDRPALLRWLSGRAAGTDPGRLGALTVSVLKGLDGYQRKEIEKLIYWLRRDVRPDIVHLSNCLLAGMAGPLRDALQVPVVCTLSGEDSFVEKLSPPWYGQVRGLMSQCSRFVDGFVALNRYYARFMSRYLGVSEANIEVIPHGLDLKGFADTYSPKPRGDTVVIGFLARICPDKGLHLLVDAVARLIERADLPSCELRAAGYLGRGEEAYYAQLRQRVRRSGLDRRFHYLGEVDRQAKIDFLTSVDVFCLPTVYPESKGLPALEASASGVPLVLPDHGSFPELIESTGGGILFRPLDPEALAEALARLIHDPELACGHGRAGREAVHARFHAAGMAQQTRRWYQKLRTASR